MTILIVTVHVIACVALIILVLLQSGKEGMGVIFGGGGSSTFFGSSGAGGLLTKLTVASATVFLITSLTYTYMSSNRQEAPRESIMLDAPAPVSDLPTIPTLPQADLGTNGQVAVPAPEAGQPAAEAVQGTPPVPAKKGN